MSWEKQRDWNRLEVASQNEAAKSSLKICCKILGLQEDVDLIDVKDNDQFVLSYAQDEKFPDFGRNMIKLEGLMRHTLGVVVDLRLEPKADKNNRMQRTGRAHLAAKKGNAP